MTALGWREGTRGDRGAFQRFECTEPGRKAHGWKRVHPRKWELDLQCEIRTLNPCSSPQRAVLVGVDEVGIAAIAVIERAQDAADYVLECVAVALRRRRAGGSGLGAEAINEAIQWATNAADAAGHDRLIIAAKTHPQNLAGQCLLRSCSFGRAPQKDWWTLSIELL